MTLFETLLVGFALSIDAYVVAMSLSLYSNLLKMKFLIAVSLLHFIMPLIGYVTSQATIDFIVEYVDWVVFLIFAVLGARMIYSAIEERDGRSDDKLKELPISTKGIYLISFALSIDSITAGYSIGLQRVVQSGGCNEFNSMIYPSLIFGACALILSITGIVVGREFSKRNPTLTEIIGGGVLMLIGLKNII